MNEIKFGGKGREFFICSSLLGEVLFQVDLKAINKDIKMVLKMSLQQTDVVRYSINTMYNRIMM